MGQGHWPELRGLPRGPRHARGRGAGPGVPRRLRRAGAAGGAVRAGPGGRRGAPGRVGRPGRRDAVELLAGGPVKRQRRRKERQTRQAKQRVRLVLRKMREC
jgi:hypothetical protein